MPYDITAFKPEVQKIIRENRNDFDCDNSNTIDDIELSKLIFSTRVDSEKDLLLNSKSPWELKREDYFMSGIATAVSGAMGLDAINAFKKNVKSRNLVTLACALGSAIFAGIATYMFVRKPVEKEIEATRFLPDPELPKNLPEDALKLIQILPLPVKTPMIEYTLKKGENLLSVIKDKYDVDDETAVKMVWKMKQAIYNDPETKKEPDVVYLPKAWEFKGTRYEFIENSKPETIIEFSDSVKTEMGKMNKDIKYSNNPDNEEVEELLKLFDELKEEIGSDRTYHIKERKGIGNSTKVEEFLKVSDELKDEIQNSKTITEEMLKKLNEMGSLFQNN